MLLDRLTAYYGIGGAEETAFITKRIESYTEEAQDRLFELITADCSKRYGFPDLQKLYKVFAEVRPDGKDTDQKVWYWFKCSNCGTQYWHDLMYCPACLSRGEKCQKVEIIKSAVPPTDSVIRFNKTQLFSDGLNKSCYECSTRQFCWNFGDAAYDCQSRLECPCNACCMRARK